MCTIYDFIRCTIQWGLNELKSDKISKLVKWGVVVISLASVINKSDILSKNAYLKDVYDRYSL